MSQKDTANKDAATAAEGGAGAASEVVAYVDAVEAGIARVLLQDKDGEWRGYSLPSVVLPAHAGEGSWLKLTLTVIPPPADAESAPALRERLGREDDGRDLKL
jgi:hypothetical protein